MLSLGSAGYGMKNSFRLHRISKSRGLSGSMTGIRVRIVCTNSFGPPVMIVQVCNHYDGGDNSVLIDDPL